MLRLTLLLLAGLGVALIVGGRDLSGTEQASLARPVARAHDAMPAAVPAAAAPAPARVQPAVQIVDPAAAARVPQQAVDRAVALAIAGNPPQDPVTPTDRGVIATRPQGPGAATDRGVIPMGTAVVASSDNVGTAPAPSVADEVAAALTDSQVWYVTGNVVNVREGPSTDYPVVGKVSYGEAAQILTDPADPWVRIRIEGDGVEGYIATRFLTDIEPNG